MTLAELICTLRQRLLDARASKDKRELDRLFTTFIMLTEASYGNEQFVGVCQDMGFAARDTLQGVDWKSTIPTIEEIESACS